MSSYFIQTLTNWNKSKKSRSNSCTGNISVRDLVKNYENKIQKMNAINGFDCNSEKLTGTKILDTKIKKFVYNCNIEKQNF